MKSSQTELYHFRPIYLLLFYAAVYALMTFLNNHYIVNSSLYYNSLSAQLTAGQVTGIFETLKKWEWVSCLLSTLIVPLKALLVSACIYTAIVLGNDKISFATVFRIVLVAEFIPLLAALVRICWLLIYPASTLQDIQYFYPLSLLSFFKAGSLPAYCLYVLQQMNVFEVLYWLALAFGLRQFVRRSFGESLRLVSVSYGLGLFVWIVIIVFVQLQIS